MRRALAVAATVAALALLVGGCASNPELASGKSRAQAAGVNAQLAMAYLQLGKLAVARHFIERALSEDSDEATVQAAAGVIYERLGEAGKARRAYTEAARLAEGDPNVMNAYAGYLCRNHQASEGEKVFREVIRNPLYQTPEVAMVNAGVCLENAGDDQGAENYFKRALVVKPNMPEAMLETGALAMRRKDPAAAADVVKRYLDVNPPTAEILWLGLRAERALGHANLADSYAQRLAKQFPNSNEARLLQAGITQ